jgi:dephospho-CoA kinase
MVVIDAPLLLEANWGPLCDAIFYVDTPSDIRSQRALDRGWTLNQFRDREAAQLSTEEKKRQATHIIPGDTDPQSLERLLRRLVEPILKRP